MSAHELLARVQALGVRVTPIGGRLRFEGATGRITPELRAALAAHKAEIMGVLTGRRAQPVSSSADSEEAARAEPISRTVVIERVRQRLSPSLRGWDDDMLVPLIHWHLAVAFDRGGEAGWRRWLPPALAPHPDAELAGLVDWEILAGMEQAHWPTNPDGAATLNRGALRLATWWSAGRAAGCW